MKYTAKQIEHKGEKRIAVYFANDAALIARFKKLDGARWSATLKTWHLPDTEANRKLFKVGTSTSSATENPVVEPVETPLRQAQGAVVEPVETTSAYGVTLPFDKLRERANGYMYILQCANGAYYTGSTKNLELRMKQHQNGEGANFTKKHLPVELIYTEGFSRIEEAFNREKQVQGWSRAKKEALINGQFNKLPDLSKNHMVAVIEPVETPKTPLRHFDKLNVRPVTEPVEVTKLKDKALLKGYSKNTVRNYISHFTIFLAVFINKKVIDDITKDEIELYLRWRQQQHTYSESYQNSHINAIKFYYEHVLNRNRMLFDLPRPQKAHQLPAVWAETDVIKMLNTIENLKHQTMFIIAYAHGMRVSEVATLKLADVDSQRMQIHIKAAKGKKDRVVNLSETALEFLRECYKKYKPKIYVFENDITHEAISIRTIQQIFSDAKNKAGLLKKAGIHSLRHSYATHLHEQGIDIKYLKDLLGHTNIKTTERYTHVSKKDISKITSPLDKLKFKRENDK